MHRATTASLFWFAWGGIMVAAAPNGAVADENSPSIAILDVATCLAEYDFMKEQTQQLLRKVKELEAVAPRRPTCGVLGAQLEDLRDAHPEQYRQIKARQERFDRWLREGKATVQQMEADAYAAAWEDIQCETALLCEEHGVQVVLNYKIPKGSRLFTCGNCRQGFKTKFAEEGELAIIYHAGVDITYDVLERLNRLHSIRTKSTR